MAKNFLLRVFKIEPGITLGQWAYDRVSNNWDKIIAIFVGGGGMTYLAAITEWIKVWGPFGIGAAGLLSVLIIWIGLSFAKSIRAGAALRRAQSEATNKWKQEVDDINPLASEFHTQRVKLLDLRNPVSPVISNKRFIDCELLGPVNILSTNSRFSDMKFFQCDVAVVKLRTPIANAITLEHCELLGGKIINCTFFIPPEAVPTFVAMGATFITLTGNPELDKIPLLAQASLDQTVPISSVAEKLDK